MRELEFLPEWYPKVRNRRRMVVAQAWVTFSMVLGLGLWMVLVQRNVYARQQELGSLQTDLCRSEEEVQRLDEALTLQKALSGKDEIIGNIGTPIEMSKVMTALDQLMPADMALVDLSLDTEEGTHAPANTLAARAAAEQKPPATRVHFKLHGVSPTDVDLAEFLARLGSKSFFKQVDLMYSHEKVDNGHVMREFEVSFALDITLPASASTAAGAVSPAGKVN